MEGGEGNVLTGDLDLLTDDAETDFWKSTNQAKLTGFTSYHVI